MYRAPLTDTVVGLVHVSQHNIGVFKPRKTLTSAVSARTVDDRWVRADDVVSDPTVRRASKTTSRPPVPDGTELAVFSAQLTNKGTFCFVLMNDVMERIDVVFVPFVMRSSASIVIVEFWYL